MGMATGMAQCECQCAKFVDTANECRRVETLNASLVDQLREANERIERQGAQLLANHVEAMRPVIRDRNDALERARSAERDRAVVQAKLDQVRNLAVTATDFTAAGDLNRIRLITAFIDGVVRFPDVEVETPTPQVIEDFWRDEPLASAHTIELLHERVVEPETVDELIELARQAAAPVAHIRAHLERAEAARVQDRFSQVGGR